MIRSMTGFGREHSVIDGREILIEIRSVNHRYLEFSTKLPRAYMYLEDKLKSLLQGKISRGKVEIAVTVYNISGKETKITSNPSVIEGYLTALDEVQKKYNLENDIRLSSVFRMNDAFNVVKADVDEDEIWLAVEQVVKPALEKFITMREVEGERIGSDLQLKLSVLDRLIKQIKEISPETVQAYRTRLFDKMREVLESTQIEEQRILLEAAIFSEKIAIDEELVRLESHLAQFKDMLETEQTVGRKLDFLIQEINREINTIGSKAQDLRVTRIVVELKSELEKIREQIQNIE